MFVAFGMYLSSIIFVEGLIEGWVWLFGLKPSSGGEAALFAAPALPLGFYIVRRVFRPMLAARGLREGDFWGIAEHLLLWVTLAVGAGAVITAVLTGTFLETA